MIKIFIKIYKNLIIKELKDYYNTWKNEIRKFFYIKPCLVNIDFKFYNQLKKYIRSND